MNKKRTQKKIEIVRERSVTSCSYFLFRAIFSDSKDERNGTTAQFELIEKKNQKNREFSSAKHNINL